MLLEYINKHYDLSALREECRKIGVNFITAGVVGVFIYHYVGTNLANMLFSSQIITAGGCLLLYLGIKKPNFGIKKPGDT